MYEGGRLGELGQDITTHFSGAQSLQIRLTPLTNHTVLRWNSTTSIKTREDEGMRTPSASPLTPTIDFSLSTVLQYATRLELVPRFHYLCTPALICL
jgi:hypothetical protein